MNTNLFCWKSVPSAQRVSLTLLHSIQPPPSSGMSMCVSVCPRVCWCVPTCVSMSVCSSPRRSQPACWTTWAPRPSTCTPCWPWARATRWSHSSTPSASASPRWPWRPCATSSRTTQVTHNPFCYPQSPLLPTTPSLPFIPSVTHNHLNYPQSPLLPTIPFLTNYPLRYPKSSELPTIPSVSQNPLCYPQSPS